MRLNRYSYLTFDGNLMNMPKVTIPKRSTDKYVTYDANRTRLDRISGEIYGDDSYSWLILLANPEYFIEFDIPRNTVIRIPFPLKEAEADFVSKVLELKDK